MTEPLEHFSRYLNKDLVTHRLVQELKRDRPMRERFRAHEQDFLAAYRGLTDAERHAIAARDFRALYELGLHPYLLGQLSRLIFGTIEGAGTSEAATALVRSLVDD